MFLRKVVYVFVLIFTCMISADFTSAQNFNSVNPGGNWVNGSTWNGGTAPGTSNVANVTITANSTVTVTGNLSVGNNGTLAVYGVLLDPAGGAAYNYDAGNSATVDIYNNMTIEGSFTATQTVVVWVHGCATLNTGPMTFSNNTVFIIDACASVNVTGNLILNNSNASTINGQISVSGSVAGNNNASVVGTGTITAQGGITSNNSSSFFGNSVNNCLDNPLPCVATGGLVTPLPIELLSFNAAESDLGIELSWATASELNNDFFTIERSLNGVEFNPIGIVQSLAANGNSSTILDYSFIDLEVSTGETYYYRLKQTDFDGTFSYSKIIIIDANSKSFFDIYPNPNNGDFTISGFLSSEKNNPSKVQIYSSLGELIWESYIESSRFEVKAEQLLQPGNYLVKFISANRILNKKIVVFNQ
jgi:hypothetical protein